ncbi:hypothetical protein M378DRAFT_173237, partial [Amanita muscaria Koide BX008]
MAANRDKETIPEGAFRILVTGFGPFGEFKVNPSWLAVKPLHDTNSLSRVDEHDKAVPLGRPIHVTTLEVPTEYEYVLNTVPGFHARPPVLPLDNSIAPPHASRRIRFYFACRRRSSRTSSSGEIGTQIRVYQERCTRRTSAHSL